MLKYPSPERAISLVQTSMTFTYCMPLPASSTKSELYRFKIVRSLLIFNAFILLLPLLYAMHVHWNDAENFSKAACMTVAILHVILQTSVCIGQYDNFQKLIEEMKICCVTAKPYERDVFQRYIDKYSLFYLLCLAWFYLAIFSKILGTLLTSDNFPTNAVYPFPVKFEPLRSIIFIQQSFVCIQCAGHVSSNIFIALLLLFATARFEVLMMELRNVENTETLIKCVKEYSILRRYAAKVTSSVRYIVLITVILCILASVFATITLIGVSRKQPFTVKAQFLIISGVGFVEVFSCALPADRLMNMSENVMEGIYESKWYERSLRIQKLVALMLTPQSPIIVKVSCIIPALSLNFYCSFISNTFSLFAALRVVMTDDDCGTSAASNA